MCNEAFETLHYTESVGCVRVHMPRFRLLGGQPDQRNICLVQAARLGKQPRDELMRVDDLYAPIVGCSAIGDRARVQDGNNGCHGNRKTNPGPEPSSNLNAISLRNIQVGGVRVVDPQHVVTDPDGRSTMVLRVNREYPAGSDYEMVNVLRVGADRYGVTDEPFGAQRGKHPPDLNLTQCARVPRPRLGSQPNPIGCLQ
jgi:hypothetical protein